MFLFNGEVLSLQKDLNIENFKFDQLDIDLNNLKTTTIKKPKVQETSSLKITFLYIWKFNNKMVNFVTKILKKK